jgi:aryl-alcohol dehydrogenase-like predicted oxidoreductase
LNLEQQRRVQLTTKVGRIYEDQLHTGPPNASHWDFSRSGILESVRLAKKMLRLPHNYRHLTVYLHDPDAYIRQVSQSGSKSVADATADVVDGWTHVVALKDAGYISRVGIGMNDAAGLAKLVDTFAALGVAYVPDEVLCAGQWNLMGISTETEVVKTQQLFDAVTRHGVVLKNAAVFGGGFLVGSKIGGHLDTANYTPPTPENTEKLSADQLRRQRLREVCGEFKCTGPDGRELDNDVSLKVAALLFAQGPVAVHSIVHSASTETELAESLYLALATMPTEMQSALNEMLPVGAQFQTHPEVVTPKPLLTR